MLSGLLVSGYLRFGSADWLQPANSGSNISQLRFGVVDSVFSDCSLNKNLKDMQRSFTGEGQVQQPFSWRRALSELNLPIFCPCRRTSELSKPRKLSKGPKSLKPPESP